MFVGLNACSDVMVKASFQSNLIVPPPPPTTATGGQATVRIVSTSGSAAAAFAGMLFFAMMMEADQTGYGRPFPSSSSRYDGFWGPSTPELDPDRKISEQDCTRPVDYSLGNIRCK
jgi:hypothetical protein